MASSITARVEAIPVRRIVNEGLTMSFREQGSGPVLVLLHGIGANSGSWVHQLESLSPEFRMIAWDAPGYGATTALPDKAPTTADYAAALDRLVQALRVDRFVLIGHSLGALIAGSYAARHPAKLRGLLLLSPAIGHAASDPAVRLARLNARLDMMRELGPAGLAERRSANVLAPDASTDARELVKLAMRQLDPKGHDQAARMLADGHLIGELAKYHGPTLVACGSVDQVTPEAQSREVAAATSTHAYCSLPDLGHACYAEAPDRVNAVIRDFCASIGVGRAG